ncbi:GTP cyclohydrolase [Ideonella dechloratans]|uniref:GTP cyclohydrolase n=1 Tax=Ideonella dechloratans TaxID=36863 RepID=A0A643F698_IDEDE|nr:YciI family protein [Ideonella dechloratans]KAB0573926.1 GTP cyclohydrolase [Ideonella dechloratans]UFU12004.1 YciI family protein [Ideonella dechloratans]
MFIVLLHYLQPLAVVEKHLAEHRKYLDRHFSLGHFVTSGPQVPRIGGVILARGLSRPELDGVLAEDPFYREKVAQYQVIEFEPNRFAEGVQAALLGKLAA